jgi:fumarate hydratase subunit beta
MEYHFNIPLSRNDVKQLKVGDILYVTGKLFTARDKAHQKLVHTIDIPFDPSSMALYHSGPLMKKTADSWQVISAGPTTSIRMERFEEQVIKEYGITLIIGKAGMGEKTRNALRKYGAVYTSFPGGAGAVAAEAITKVLKVYWLKELGMPEAVWILEVKEFGPLVVSMDAQGNTLYEYKR